jgi:hypothetical protein
MSIMIRFFFFLLLSLNVVALQFFQPTDGQNTVKPKLGRSGQPLPTTPILTQLSKDAKSGNIRAQLSYQLLPLFQSDILWLIYIVQL